MSGNLSLLTGLFIMCYFIKKGGNYAVTTITRAHFDCFTDVCQDCYKYGAETERGICKCEPKSTTLDMGSVFLRDQRKCIDEIDLMTTEQCKRWKKYFVEVIDTEETHSYPLKDEAIYSYQLEPLISYRNSTTGEWQFFNLSGNVLVMQNGPDPWSWQIKVTQVSPNLTKYKGYVMKLGLKRKRLDGKTKELCLLFKAKGDIHNFPLNCSIPTTPVSTTTTSSPPTTTVTPTTTGGPTTMQPGIIVAIATGVTALVFMSLVCTVLVVHRYTYMCRPRALQARNLGHDVDVIRNPGPHETYRIQEEHVYDDVSNIFPCGKGSGCSTNECEEIATVILNPANEYEAHFSVQRRTREPLPSRPELAGNTNREVDAGAVHQNDESEAIRERAEDSMVFKNPEAEASSSSLPGLEIEAEGHEPERQSIADHHHHVEDDIDSSTVHKESEGTSDDHYQRLVQDKRPRSLFICPSCNENPVYQRLSMPHSCPHGAKDKLKENGASSYESLSGREQGSRKLVYARPSQIIGELAAEDKGNRNSEEGEGQPEYHTLEQEEAAVSNEDLTEPVNHDYNELEGPGETGDEKDSISRDPDQTSVDSDLSPKILNMEDNPAYAKPWKTKEDPELSLEPSDFLNIDHNPLYSTPWKTKTAEPCLKRRAYSM